MRSVLTGMALAVGCMGLAGCSSDSLHVKGEIVSIDRQCTYIQTMAEGPEKGKKVGETVEDCTFDEEFRRIMAAEASGTRNATIDAKGTLTVAYLPEGSEDRIYTDIKISGQDDIFYTAKAEQPIALRVSKTDPEQVRLD